MRVADAMTSNVRLVNPNHTICDVAKIMADADIGALPVGENDRLIGMITDRDIVIRAIAQGKFDTKVRDVMSEDVKYCFDDEELADVAHNMADIQVRRLPVVNRDKRLVGIVSLADIAINEDPQNVGAAVCGISEAGGQHHMQSQSRH